MSTSNDLFTNHDYQISTAQNYNSTAHDDNSHSETDTLTTDTAKVNKASMMDMRILVVGMPNVGKSSLLNALRRVGVRKGESAILDKG